MSDNLRSLFDGATNEVPAPAGDLASVIRRGRARRGYGAALGTAAFVLLLTGAWVAVENARSGDDVPPARPGPDEKTYLLVPTETSPEPPSAFARKRDLEDARAVTVAFHALLHRVGYDLDYKNVVPAGRRAWEVTFLDAGEEEAANRALQAQMEALLATRARVAEQVDRLVELDRNLRAKARAAGSRGRSAARKAKAIGREADAVRRTAAELRAEMRELEERLGTIRRRRGAGIALAVLRVERAGPELVVASVRGPSGGLERVVGYSERVADVDVWGADYYDGSFEEPGAVDDVGGFEMHGFWTGPIPGAYRERCIATLVEFRGGGGEVWRQRGAPPYHGAPATEDARDGWTTAFGIDYEGSAVGLDPLLRCSWRVAR